MSWYDDDITEFKVPLHDKTFCSCGVFCKQTNRYGTNDMNPTFYS